MRQIRIIILLLLFPLASFAQLVGIGSQYVKTDLGNDIQFAASASFPVWHKKNAFNSFLSSGIEYTGGSSSVAGLNIKPIQISTFLSENLFNNYSGTFLLSCDAGYLFNFKHGQDGVVITPNIYADYKGFYIKTGYDFNITNSEQQFFVRFGVNFGIGTFKMFAKTRIW